MVFSSNVFVFFFLPLTLAGYFLLKPRYRNIQLLLVSLVFYAWGEPTFVLIMLLSIAVNYGLGLLFAVTAEKPGAKRAVLIVTIVWNVGLMFVYKYLNFTIANINAAFGRTVIQQTEFILPIGISFFTFQAMSYVLDVYRGAMPVQRNPLHLGLYISFFPQLIAGPIVRYNDIAEQIEHREITPDGFQQGVRRFLLGFNKKILLANTLAIIADKAFAVPDSAMSAPFAWLGALAYTFQIFYDFSGYSDMAIGLGRMFGFTFLENFDYPYIAGSVSAFWRRWHISLGSWFRQYVYIPLGGSRGGMSRTIRNLFVVWLLTGIWHGANWTFILWGLFYFALIAMERLTGLPEKLPGKVWPQVYRAVVLLCVVLSWVLFRAVDVSSAIAYLRAMFSFGTVGIDHMGFAYLREYGVYFLFAVLFAIPLRTWLAGVLPAKWQRAVDVGGMVLTVLLFVLSLSHLALHSYNPFIYFDF